MHSYNQFHAAGHGTFFSGQVIFPDKTKFLWVYDCGSKRHGRIKTLVDDLHGHAKTDEIDMLCISHFDGDHVNGLFELLSTFTVKRLFLPYLPFDKRLQIACNLDLDVAGSTDAMLFTLDPAGLLSARGLRDSVGQIVFVRGGESNPDAVPRDIDDFPGGDPDIREGENEEAGRNLLAQDVPGDYRRMVGDKPAIPSIIMSHATPVTVFHGLWEFIFYNNQLPDDAARVSKKSLAEIQDELKAILAEWDLNSGKAKEVEGWRQDFRKCYERHFGKSSKGRNDISLCLLSTPMMAGKYGQCHCCPR